MRYRLVALALALLVALCAAPAQTQQAYGMDRTSTLYLFDPTTGAATAIGALGIGPVTGSAISPATGILYTDPGGGGCCPKPNSGCLYRVDLMTGAATQVGCDPNQGGNDPIPGLAFGPDGFLYGARLAYNAQPKDKHMYLCRVDTLTGVLTDIGDFTHSGWCEGYGMAFGNDSKLYSHDECVGLTTISTTTAARTVIGGSFVGFPAKITDRRIPDMALGPSGVMWAIVVDGDPSKKTAVYYTGRVNTTTGDVTYVATLPASIQTIAFIAEPAIPTLGEWGIVLFAVFVGLAAAYLLARPQRRTA
jgi:hypothetical protein